MTAEEKLLKALDIKYSYRLAKRMEEKKTNPLLGYRTAGSWAELETGDMLKAEMEEIGLSDVRKDEITVDSWEFQKAELEFEDEDGITRKFQLGAYQTQFVTDGKEEMSLVYAGRGTEKDYDGLDVKGKLVLVNINQREEWWINFPVYQAYLKGAKALIAVQAGGYGEIDEKALNAQDIAGPKEAAAFSMSWEDAQILKAELKKKQEIRVLFDAVSNVKQNQKTYNIVGTIPGKNKERMILLSAHYDSYFDGFQDDNTAVSMMLGIAKGLLESGYKPKNTILFCALAAEEWGVVDSKYDWSSGAYEQVFTAHPEWRKKVIADLNFELPALAHGKKDAIHCTYEYVKFLKEFLKETEDLKIPEAYPEGIEIQAPIETWSDDFSMAIAGIPSMVNEFSTSSFMETHYHSQFDNDIYYDEEVYRFHHELYGRLVLWLDQLAIVPLDFENVMYHLGKSVSEECSRQTGAPFEELQNKIREARELGQELYKKIEQVNQNYKKWLKEGHKEEAEKLYNQMRTAEQQLLTLFQKEQDMLVRLNWHDEVLFPQEAVQNNLFYLENAIVYLKEKDLKSALQSLYKIDNNRYAFLFEEEVYNHFTEYVLHQPKERLKWGADRIVHHENLYALVKKMMEKIMKESQDDVFEEEIAYLEMVKEQQRRYYVHDILYVMRAVDEMKEILQETKEEMESYGNTESISSDKGRRTGKGKKTADGMF